MNRSLLLSALAGALALAALPACAADSLFADRVLARGQGVEVTRNQLDDAFVAFRANLASRGQNIPEDRRQAAEAQLLDRIVITQLLMGRVTEADRAKAKEAAARFFDTTRKTVRTDEDFYRQLRSMGMSAQQFTNRVMEQALSEEIINRELKSKISIPEQAIREFYATNEAPFKQPDMARIGMILVTTRDLNTRLDLNDAEKRAKKEKAEKIMARAKRGEDFGKLALETSEDPNVKENKGELVFARAKDDPRRAIWWPELEAAAFSMRTNQVSDLITTETGFHIIKLLELQPARRVPLPEVQKQITDFLSQQELDKQMPAFFRKLKEEGKVQVLDEKLAAELARKPEETSLK